MKTFEKVTPFVKQNIHKLIFGIILLIIIDLISLIIPKIMQYAIDGIGTEGFTKLNLFYAGVVILLIAALMTFMRYFWRLLLLGNAWFVDKSVRQEYYDHLMSLSANFFNKIKTGDLMAYAINDLNAIRMLVGFSFVIGVDIIVLTAASLSFMVNINLRLTLLAVIPLPLLSIIIIVLGKKIHKRFGKVQQSFATMSGKVQESISGIRVVKAFVQEESELGKISDSAYDYVKQNLSLVRIQGVFHPSFMLIIGLSMMIVMVYGGEATMVGEITIGQFVAFYQYLGMFIWPMIAIGWVVNLYQRGTASLKRLNKIFDEQPEIIDEESVDHTISQLKGKIKFEHLVFRYNEKNALIFDDIMGAIIGVGFAFIMLMGSIFAWTGSMSAVYENLYSYRSSASTVTTVKRDTGSRIQCTPCFGIGSGIGAGFPAGFKWQFCFDEKDPVKYMLCNADEGDLGPLWIAQFLRAIPTQFLKA